MFQSCSIFVIKSRRAIHNAKRSINRGGHCARARARAAHVASHEIFRYIFAFDFGPFDRTPHRARQGTRRQTEVLIMRTHERFETEVPKRYVREAAAAARQKLQEISQSVRDFNFRFQADQGGFN